MRPSDKKLLEIVIKEYYGESHDKPYWFRDDEFKKFYDSLIDNSDFLGILQGLKQDYNASRQNKKLDNVGQSIQDIKDQIERQGEQQSTQLDNVLETVQKDSEQIQEKQEQQLSLEKEILEKVKNNSKSQKQIIAEPEYPIGLRRYENVLCINEEISFLDDATENLIRDSRLFLEDVNIDRVRHCLDEKKACLIMAPEGRGKTYLSRIIAYKYHHEQRMEVFFLDFKDSNRVRDNSNISIGEFQDQLQEWHKIKEKNYLLVLENVHAYHYLSALKELIVTRLRIQDNHTWFLLNARPTDIELEDFSDWEEQTIDLKPDIKNINGIINLYAKELEREPFGDNEQDRTAFIERIYPHENNPVGANLRLLSIYLKTWQKHPEKQYITDIDEQTILKDFRKTYLENKSFKEKEVLWYISCLYQFDVPLHEDLNQEVGNFKNDFLRYDGSQYHLPHSVDAFFLFKAICNYKKSDYREKTREFVNCYVNAILASSNPRKFEGDFRLLRQGLFERKDEFRVLINELADWPMAEKIIRNINPRFVIQAFNTRNGHSSEEILEYYKANIGWLKTTMLELSASGLNLFCHNYKKHTKHSVFEGYFKNPVELNDYLKINDRVFCGNEVLEAISDLGEKYKRVLIDYYEQNKNRLKPSFLESSPVQLLFIYRFFKSDFNVFEDIFEDTKDLEDYLRNNDKDKIFHIDVILEAISGIGAGHKHVLIECYKQNKDRLKPSFLELSPTKLAFVYIAYKKHFEYNIIRDIFKDPKDLEDYLTKNDITFNSTTILKAICDLGNPHKKVLKSHYEGIRFDYFLYSTKNGYRISSGTIDALLFGSRTFDVHRIDENNFYFAGIHWMDIQRFVYIIRKSMNVDNKQHSIEVVKAIIQKVLAIKGSLSYASAHDLSLFLTNIAAVDKDLFEKLINEEFVIKNIKYRLSSQKYSLDYLRLFSLFYNEKWFYRDMIKIVNRTLESLNEADEKDLSTFLGNMSYMNAVFYNDLIVNETVVGIAKKRFETFSFREDYLYLFGHFYSQPWCKEILEQKINNADDGQIAIIKEWYDKVMEGLKKRSEEGEETEAKGGLLEYIHNKPFIQQQNN